MPYLKFSRDKRGYEHFAIVEPGVPRRGKPARSRVLFMFRTPPQIKVGRMPFTDEVRRALEAQYPNVRFDWPRLLATPIPPPDADHWRERRRAEKAARQAARESALAEEADEAEETAASAPDAAVAADAPQDTQPVAAAVADEAEPAPGDEDEAEDGEDDETVAAGAASDSQGLGASPPAAGPDAARPVGRRRRRRGRRRRPQTAVPGPEPSAPAAPDRSTDEV